ncbi:MAG TPA: HEAT repeat domain-containing protein [Planctomycetaceae bacterium]|jgi:HEAT repeat protein|nr:HEAT repeat domain-containing protein [Planctomycetaceae bacterium]
MRIVRLGLRITCVSLCLLLAAPAVANDRRIRANAVHDWLAALREPVEQPQDIPRAWNTAQQCLGKIGPDHRDVLPELILALDHPVARVRAAAASAIGNIGPEAKDAVPKLRALLPKPGQDVEEDAGEAAAALSKLGDEAVEATDDLASSLGTSADWAFEQTLSRLGCAAVPAIARGLKHKDPNVRERCLTLLAQLNCPEMLDPGPQLDLLGDQSESTHRGGCFGPGTIRVGSSAPASLVRFGPKIVPRLRKLLHSSNPVIAIRAAAVLANLKVFDQEVADQLVNGWRRAETEDEVWRVLRETERSKDPRVLSRLRALLKDHDLNVRARAAVFLSVFEAVDLDVLRVQIERLSALEFAREAADVLINSGAQLKPLEHELVETATRGNAYQARWLAAGLLGRMMPTHPAVAANLVELRKTIQSKDQVARSFALQSAFLMGELGWPTVFELLKREDGCCISSTNKSFEKPLITELCRAAKEPKPNRNYISGLILLASTNCSAEALRPHLAIFISNLEPRQQAPFDPGVEAAVRCIEICGTSAVPELLCVLQAPKSSDRLRIATLGCLARIGPKARDALPVLASRKLIKPLEQPWAVAIAIDAIGPSIECLPVLIELAETRAAQTAILALGERARSEVLKLLESPKADQRKVGLQLLLEMPVDAGATVPTVVRILKESTGNEVDLLRILARIGPSAWPAAPDVISLLRSPYVRVRSAACITLGRIFGPGKAVDNQAIDSLLAAAGDGFAEVRASSADALGLISLESDGVRSALERLRHDNFATVRNAAERATRAHDQHTPAPAKLWTIYFDPAGPASGSYLASE